MQMLFADVPLDTRRRVVALLENLRKTVADPTGGMASLNGRVTQLFGLDGELAYYEFEVDLGRRLHGPTIGFIIASASGPDQLHWSFDREPPSAALSSSGTRRGGPRGSKVRDTLRATASNRVVA